MGAVQRMDTAACGRRVIHPDVVHVGDDHRRARPRTRDGRRAAGAAGCRQPSLRDRRPPPRRRARGRFRDRRTARDVRWTRDRARGRREAPPTSNPPPWAARTAPRARSGAPRSDGGRSPQVPDRPRRQTIRLERSGPRLAPRPGRRDRARARAAAAPTLRLEPRLPRRCRPGSGVSYRASEVVKDEVQPGGLAQAAPGKPPSWW